MESEKEAVVTEETSQVNEEPPPEQSLPADSEGNPAVKIEKIDSETEPEPPKPEKRKLHNQAPQQAFLVGPKLTLRKILHSKQGEYRVLKTFGGGLYGLIFFIFFYNTFMQQLALPDYMRYTLVSVMFSFLIFGCAYSIQIRCTVSLTMPGFFTKYCRNMMMSLAILYLMTGPVSNLAKNMEEASRAISCSRSLAMNVSSAQMELTFKPVKQALAAMQGASPSFQNENEKSADTFDPTEEETYDEDTKEEDEKATEAAGRYDINIKKNEAKIKSSAQNLPKVQTDFQLKTDFRCMNFFNEIDEKCRDKVSEMKKKCRTYFWLRLFGICGFFDKLIKQCNIKTLIPDLPAELPCDAEGPFKGVAETYALAAKTTQILRESFRPAFMQFKIKAYFEGLTQNSPEELAYRLKESIQSKVRFLNDLIGLIKIVVTFLFVMIFFKASKIHQKYLVDVTFNNTVLTDYFFRIDYRRRVQGKSVILPLRRLEKNVLGASKSLRISPLEMAKLRMGIVRSIVVIALFVGVVFIDLVLAECMRIVNKHSRTATMLFGHHIIKVTTTGESKVAQLMRRLVGSFSVQHTINQVFSNDHCLPVPNPQYTSDLVDMFGTLVLVVLSHLGEAYAQRSIIAICSFYYPKQAKKRTLHLYNDVLKKRKGFFKFARKVIRKKVYQNKLLDIDAHKWELLFMKYPILEKILGKMPFAKRKCIMCNEYPKGISIKCQTPYCFVLYCQTCWQDINAVCLACQDQEDWTTDSEGYSDSG